MQAGPANEDGPSCTVLALPASFGLNREQLAVQQSFDDIWVAGYTDSPGRMIASVFKWPLGWRQTVSKATKNTAEKKSAKKGRALRWLIVAGAVVAVGIVLASGGLVTAIQLENRNAFCASCHTEPESQFYQRSLAAPVDLASAHNAKNVPCIQCHSGPGTTGRVEAITSVAAPDTFAFYSGHYRKPATITAPIGDEHCLKCHADVSTRQDFNNHFHAFLPRWQAQAPKDAATCVECHQGHNANGRADIAYLEEFTTATVCERCHSTIREE